MSIGADIKALVDTTAVTETYREGYVPDSARFPYASFIDPVSDGIALQGDAQTLARRRLTQVDLWQKEPESVGLVDTLVQAIDGQKASGFRLSVTDVQRLPEPERESDVVHHAITVSSVHLS